MNLSALRGIKQEKFTISGGRLKKDEFTISSSKMLPSRDDIRVEFKGKNLTKFGGIPLLRKFLRQLRVKGEIESAVLIEKRESKFSVAEILICLLYAIILDMKRQNDTLMFRLDKVFQKMAGVDDYPVQSTISRFLSREHDKRRDTILFIGCEYPPFLWSHCSPLPFGYACIQFNELI